MRPKTKSRPLAIFDISMEISEDMHVYKNRIEKRPKIEVTRTLKDGANESKLDIFVHTGSHVDAPYHVLQNGKTIEKLNPGRFMGRAIVLDFTKVKGGITEKHFKKLKLKGIVLPIALKGSNNLKANPNSCINGSILAR